MTAKTARVYTLDELKEKCQQALENPKLVEIVKTAPLNKDGKVNLSWVYKEAERYVHGETHDLQKTKELAVETRNLGKIRRISQEEFEKLVAQKKQLEPEIKPMEPKKQFSEMEFKFPHNYLGGQYADDIGTVEVIYRDRPLFIRFRSTFDFERTARMAGKKFSLDILNALIETANPPGDMDLMNDLIQLLEEKFGLKVKVCGNCKHLQYRESSFVRPGYECWQLTRDREKYKGPPLWDLYGAFAECTCDGWTPKEFPEKPSSA